jgi:hypothetical protein
MPSDRYAITAPFYSLARTVSFRDTKSEFAAVADVAAAEKTFALQLKGIREARLRREKAQRIRPNGWDQLKVDWYADKDR